MYISAQLLLLHFLLTCHPQSHNCIFATLRVHSRSLFLRQRFPNMPGIPNAKRQTSSWHPAFSTNLSYDFLHFNCDGARMNCTSINREALEGWFLDVWVSKTKTPSLLIFMGIRLCKFALNSRIAEVFSGVFWQFLYPLARASYLQLISGDVIS